MNYEVSVRLFGAFRNVLQDNTLMFLIQEPVTYEQFKELLYLKIKEKIPTFADLSLIHDSALANGQELLRPGSVISKSCEIAVLPPVCGG